MARFLISHYSDDRGVKQIVIAANTQEEALKSFFNAEVESYSKDSTGYTFFKEDFFDSECPLGAIRLLEE